MNAIDFSEETPYETFLKQRFQILRFQVFLEEGVIETCVPPHIPPRPPPTYPIAALVIADLFQMSGYDIARLYETFRERRFQASTFQTFLGGWSEDGVPKISPMARTLGDSRSILLYIYLYQKSGKGPALNYQNVIGQLEVFLRHPNCHTKR